MSRHVGMMEVGYWRKEQRKDRAPVAPFPQMPKYKRQLLFVVIFL